MVRHLFRRLASAGLLLFVLGGGGSLPVVDSLLLHRGGAEGETQHGHYEADSGCHLDGCATHSTAAYSKSLPEIAAGPVQAGPTGRSPEAVPYASPDPLAPLSSHLSRAPPILV